MVEAAATGGSKRRVVIVTGLSGAGMSSVLKVLEDLGYETVDNLPLDLVRPFLDLGARGSSSVALSVDVRTRGFSATAMLEVLAALRSDPALEVTAVFVDCDPERLLQRYTETRRRHPLAQDRPVSDGITVEESLMGALRDRVDVRIDTSLMTIHDLRRHITHGFSIGGGPGLVVTVTSFAFRRGLPREADLVFDVRFLENPHWVPTLRPLTGLDPAVVEHVQSDDGFTPFLGALTAMLGPLLPRYNREGKSYLTLAVGCTGGKHRSVVVACKLGEWFTERGFRTAVVHRDMPSGPQDGPEA